MNRKAFYLLLVTLLVFGCSQDKKSELAQNSLLKISVINTDNTFWEYTVQKTGKIMQFAAPVFEIDGKSCTALLSNITTGDPQPLGNGVTSYQFSGPLRDFPDIELLATFRIAENSAVVKFCYELHSNGGHKLTKTGGVDQLGYLSVSLNGFQQVKEVRFSEFNDMIHSFCLDERAISENHFTDSLSLMGPMLVSTDGQHSSLVAYEHGSQVPDRFLEFRLKPDRSVELFAVKGNYYNGFELKKENPFQTIWFETCMVPGDEDQLAATYRDFVLKYMSLNTESRKPYIFYNTWNYQERMRNWQKKPYLTEMTFDRMIGEIEVAHKMGIEVFVVDAGWFDKTGDWLPSPTRFPDGLKTISKTLQEKGMKLGLWFNPTVAAKSSNMLKNNRECVRTRNGSEGKPWPIWETEESYGMCLASPYRDAFANELIRLNKELGVTYFKWDAIGQYECDDPRHFHGTAENSEQERLESYAFEISRSMCYVVDKLAKECPDAIVDFDITEGGRAVGLGFLASGKYFLINNGPYYFNYDIPFDRENGQWNIFFFPGPARTWICRTPLTFDKWIPTSLFLTHYLPDDPYENQSLAVGSLILGQNGIWGDLPAISPDGVDFFGKTLALYKQVRDDMTATALTRDGAVGGSPEVYEKVNPENGRGAIVMFANHTGSYSYISKNKVNPQFWNTRSTDVKILPDGRVRIDGHFKGAEAKIVFFGVKE